MLIKNNFFLWPVGIFHYEKQSNLFIYNIGFYQAYKICNLFSTDTYPCIEKHAEFWQVMHILSWPNDMNIVTGKIDMGLTKHEFMMIVWHLIFMMTNLQKFASWSAPEYILLPKETQNNELHNFTWSTEGYDKRRPTTNTWRIIYT